MKRSPGSTASRAAALAAALIIPAGLLFGGNGGSVYSRFGIGDLRFTSATQLSGIGGTGAAYRPSGAVNDVNPAAWSWIPRVRFSAALMYEGFSTTDGTNSAYLAGTMFNGLSLAVPVDSGLGLAFAAGVSPYSRVNYIVRGDVSQAGLDYTLERRGDGGISRAFAGLSFGLLPGLSAAGQFDYYFGSNRYILSQSFGGSAYAGAELTRTESVKGPGATFGVLYDSLGRALGLPGGQDLAIGVALATASWPTVTGERIYHYGAATSSTSYDTLDGGTHSFRIPFSLTGGLSYRSGNVLAAADVRYQDWDGAEFDPADGVTLKSGLRLSAGVEITRGTAPANIPPARRTTYMAGLYHDSGYLEIGGERVGENGITAGIAFPLYAETRLSLAASFAMRGSTDNLLQEDKIFRISASIDVAEIWFLRPAEE